MKRLADWWKGLAGLAVVVALALAFAWLLRATGQGAPTGQQAGLAETQVMEDTKATETVPPEKPPVFLTTAVLTATLVPSPVPSAAALLTPTETVGVSAPQVAETPLSVSPTLPADALVFPIGQSADGSTFKVVRYDASKDTLAQENVVSSLGNILPPVGEFIVSPDRRFIALNLMESDGQVPIPYLVSADGVEVRHLLLSEEGAGRVLAWIPGTDRLLVDGAPAGASVNLEGKNPLPLLNPLVYGGAASPDGEWLVLASAGHARCSDAGQYCFYFVKRDGTQGWYTPIPAKARGGITPYEVTWSPDGKRIAYVDSFAEGWFQVRTVNTEGQDLQVLGPEKMRCVSPVWSPDSTFLVYACAESDHKVYRYWDRVTWVSGVWVADVASGQVKQIVPAEDKAAWWPTWLPDGSGVVFVSNRGGGNDLWFVRPDGTGLRQLTFDGQTAD